MKELILKNFSGKPTPKNRTLDVVVPSYNRPLRLYNFLKVQLNSKYQICF